MISGSTSHDLPIVKQGLQTYSSVTDHQDIASSSLEASNSGQETQSTSLLYNLSVLKDKFHQVESLVSILISPADHQSQPESASMAIARMGILVQEIIVTASSMLFTCQQMAEIIANSGNNSTDDLHQQNINKVPGIGLSQSNNFGGNSLLQERRQPVYWYGDHDNYNYNINTNVINNKSTIINNVSNYSDNKMEVSEGSTKNYDIIELDAADLLAKYTHYCQICDKGFKRDANLRMHMRAHGDEYKVSSALANPLKKNISSTDNKDCLTEKPARKFSCPQEGCRWNQRHAKFQPLKSMICVKNHYKRSHCPKMYICKRCNRKQFSVLSDLRTHEKHCGDLKWQCSCGTTFSRKDKLMGHVTLFVGHSPAVVGTLSTNTTTTTTMKQGKVEREVTRLMQSDDRE